MSEVSRFNGEGRGFPYRTWRTLRRYFDEDGNANPQDLAALSGVSIAAVYQQLSRAVARGDVERTGLAEYRLTPSGGSR